MSDLTYEKLRAVYDSLPKPEPDLFNPFRLSLRQMGREVFIATCAAAQDPGPRYQVRGRYINSAGGIPGNGERLVGRAFRLPRGHIQGQNLPTWELRDGDERQKPFDYYRAFVHERQERD